MANPVTVGDLELRWRPLDAQETVNAEAFLDDAWWLLLARRPTLEADLAAGTVLEGNVIRVVTSIVLRLLRNPDGYKSESVGTYSYTRDELVAGGALFVTADELAVISPSGGRKTRSVRLIAHGDL